jgi:hypothetical protein
MDTFTKVECFDISLGDCRYKAMCPHRGSYLYLQTLDNSLKHPQLFTPDQAESFGDMESFLMLKKVFYLRETGYWRS